MTGRERGFLLLTSQLGNPERRPLTTAQLRTLSQRAAAMEKPLENRELDLRDLTALGCTPEFARRILSLLEDEALLNHYLNRGRSAGCTPVTRVSAQYPQRLRRILGEEAPGCLWARGDLSVMERCGVSLVGSRDLRDANREFAREAGCQAANQGYVLISGNARGADREAQYACHRAGGSVISIVADELVRQELRDGALYLSEDDFDQPFSVQRALSRNRCIHAMGQTVLVAQATLHKGGTWDGTSRNLRFGWSSVCCYDDGSEAAAVLEQMGAFLIGTEALSDLKNLPQYSMNFFDQ